MLGCLALLAAMAWLGSALLRRASDHLTPLERGAHGAVLGAVLGSLVLLLIASGVGLSVPLVVGVGLACAVGAAALGRGAAGRSTGTVVDRLARHRRRLAEPGGWLAALVLGAIALRWVALWQGMLTTDAEGLWIAQRNVWADWARHLGDVTSFAYGDNFPPTHPRLAGNGFGYHYLTSVTVAALVRLGLDPRSAAPLHSLLFSMAVLLVVFAFARRLGLGRKAASLGVVLFLFGGGLGWWLPVADALGEPHPLAALGRASWDPAAQEAANFRWQDVYFSLIAPQRAYLYGLPLGLLTLTLLRDAVRTGERRGFVAAGLVAGLLPFAHLGTLLALALLTPFLVLSFPHRRWTGFYSAWILVALPQLGLQLGGGPGPLGALRLQPGWIASPDPWVWFWLKNVGLLLPLWLAGLVDRRVLAAPDRRFLRAFVSLFLLANLVVFQPWDWDNTKVLVYWFLSACLLAAAWLEAVWRRRRALVPRALLAAAVATLLLSGLLQHVEQLRGGDRHLFLTTDELRLAEQVRRSTDARAVFAVGLQHNHPVPVLTGRRVVMGYPGWLWSHGVDYRERERDLRTIFALGREATRLIERYAVDYVVVGPDERVRFDADPAAFRARYPTVIRTETYEVFRVRDQRQPGSQTRRSKASGRSGRPVDTG